MNRDEAKEIVFFSKEIRSVMYAIDNEVDALWLLRKDLLKHIDKIYEDVESRLCENCIHDNTCEMQEVLRKGVTNTKFLKTFGCNSFERKES